MNRLEIGMAMGLLMVVLSGCIREDDSTEIRASGHVEGTQVHLACKVGGRLMEMAKDEGEPVAAGGRLAAVETVDAEIALAGARAELEVSDANLRMLLSGTRMEDIRRAEEQLGQARAELDSADRDVTRLEGLADRGSATVKMLDDARTRKEIAQRAVEGARAQLEKLTAGPRKEEIDMARARRAGAEAAVDAIQQKIMDAVLLAPRSGVITSRLAEPGEIASPGQPLYILTDLDHVWLNVYVEEPQLSDIRLGSKARVKVDGHADNFSGNVSFVSPVAEFTPKNVKTPDERAKLVYRVKIQLQNPDGVFKPGMPADAIFEKTN